MGRSEAFAATTTILIARASSGEDSKVLCINNHEFHCTPSLLDYLAYVRLAVCSLAGLTLWPLYLALNRVA